MPAPMMAPMPRVIRFIAPSERFRESSPCSPASSESIDIGLTRSSLDMYEGLPPQESVTDSLQLERILPFGETRRDTQGYLAGQAPGPATCTGACTAIIRYKSTQPSRCRARAAQDSPTPCTAAEHSAA